MADHRRTNQQLWNEWSDAFQSLWNANTADGELPPAPSPFAPDAPGGPQPEVLESITVPTLVLYGEHETAIISRHAPTLAAEIPDATVREVPDAGHASPWDNPTFFNSAIQTFIASRVPVEAEENDAT